MNSKVSLEGGFTLVEALVATAIVVCVTAGVIAVLNPARGVFRMQPEAADIQQRLRIGVDTLSRDLVSAGAGVNSGVGAGSLGSYFAPIMPFRRGSDPSVDDGPGVFKSNAITIVSVPLTAAQTGLALDMPTASSPIAIRTESGCPRDASTRLVDPLCGFKAGVTKAVIFDETGAFDAFTIASADATSQTLDVQHDQRGGLSKAYSKSASNHLTKVVEVAWHVYYLNTATRQLMHDDGFSTVSPVLDNVVGLGFEYYGDPSPPALVRPGQDRTVTYGLSPPEADVAQVPFARGENCAWQMSAGGQVTRLMFLGGGGGLVKLTSSQLTDGPWCPDEGNANRYDVDLLRIRKVRVTLRVQAGNDVVRGSLATGNAAMFVNRGTALSRAQTVPDQTVRFDVSPRNLSLSR